MHVGEEDRKRIASALKTTSTLQLPPTPAPIDLGVDEAREMAMHPRGEQRPVQEGIVAPTSSSSHISPSSFPDTAEEGYFSLIPYPDLSESGIPSDYHTPATTPQQYLPHTGLGVSTILNDDLSVPNSGYSTTLPVCQQTVQFHDACAMIEGILQKAESNSATNQSLLKASHSDFVTTSVVLSEIEVWRGFVNNTVSECTPTEAVVLQVLYFSGRISVTKPHLQNSCDMGHEVDPSHAMIAVCISAAQDMAHILPDQPNEPQSNDVALFCTLIPHLVQAISVFLLELSAVGMNPQSSCTASFDSLKKLIRWLRALRQYDDTAEQAHTKMVSLFRAAANEILRRV